jgi:hypothetical protein
MDTLPSPKRFIKHSLIAQLTMSDSSLICKWRKSNTLRTSFFFSLCSCTRNTSNTDRNYHHWGASYIIFPLYTVNYKHGGRKSSIQTTSSFIITVGYFMSSNERHGTFLWNAKINVCFKYVDWHKQKLNSPDNSMFRPRTPSFVQIRSVVSEQTRPSHCENNV